MTTRKELDLDKLMQQAVQAHLTDEELGEFHDGVADPISHLRIEAHLKRCLICAHRLNMMQEILTKEEPRLEEAALPDATVLAASSLQPYWPRIVLPLLMAAWALSMKRTRIAISSKGARASVITPFEEGQTEGGELSWCISEESGGVIVRFSSYNLQLDGAKFLLKAGPLKKEVTLRPVTEDQVGAEVFFTWEERSQMAPDTFLSIEAIDKD